MRVNDLNSNHDEWEYTRLNIAWVETTLDGIFWIGIIWVGIFLVVIILAENCLGGSYTRWEFS